MTPQTVLAMCRERDVKAVDLRFMDFPGLWQHFTIPVEQARRGSVRGRPGLRRLQHPRLAGDQRERHARSCRSPTPRSSIRSPQIPTLCDDLQHPGPDHARGLHPRPAQRRPQGGQLPEEHRHRRHLLHRPRGRVLHLRRRPLRPDAQRAATTTSTAIEGEWNRGRDEKPEPGLQAAPQGRLLPGAAGRPADGHPQRDDADDDRLRPRRRSPAPRSRHRRPVRDRHEVQRAGEDGRPDVHVQVHHQERRQEVQQDRHVHAQAAVQRQRLRHAHAHLALEGRQAAVRRQRLRRPERDGACTPSAAS